MNKIFERIEQRRKALGLSQAKVLAEAGLSAKYLARLKNSPDSSITGDSAEKIAAALNTTPEWVLFEVEAQGSSSSTFQLSAALLSQAEENVDKLALTANKDINREQRTKLKVLHYEILYREAHNLSPLTQEEIALLS